MDVEPASTRTVTLLVAHEARLLGSIGPFEVASPWWQDTEQISRRFPHLAVLRLLDVSAPPGATHGGTVRYLAEQVGLSPGAVPLELGPVPEGGAVDEDPMRMPWADPEDRASISNGWPQLSP